LRPAAGLIWRDQLELDGKRPTTAQGGAREAKARDHHGPGGGFGDGGCRRDIIQEDAAVTAGVARGENENGECSIANKAPTVVSPGLGGIVVKNRRSKEGPVSAEDAEIHGPVGDPWIVGVVEAEIIGLANNRAYGLVDRAVSIADQVQELGTATAARSRRRKSAAIGYQIDVAVQYGPTKSTRRRAIIDEARAADAGALEVAIDKQVGRLSAAGNQGGAERDTGEKLTKIHIGPPKIADE
jgi:hypothetical protein